MRAMPYFPALSSSAAQVAFEVGPASFDPCVREPLARLSSRAYYGYTYSRGYWVANTPSIPASMFGFNVVALQPLIQDDPFDIDLTGRVSVARFPDELEEAEHYLTDAFCQQRPDLKYPSGKGSYIVRFMFERGG